MGLGTALLGLTALSACKGGDTPALDDSRIEIPIETGAVDDTGEPTELTAIELSPASLTLAPGGSFTLRSYGVFDDGHRERLELPLSLSGEALSVDGEQVTALSAGSATLSVEHQGLSASAEITVSDAQALSVQVVEARTGTPLEDARVVLGEQKLRTDAQGRVTLIVENGEPVSVTAYTGDATWVPATVYGVVTRELVLPLRAASELSAAETAITGTVDFSGLVEAEPDQQQLALTGTSLANPVLIGDGDFLAPTREVSFYGAELQLPSNLSLATHAPTYAVPATDTRALWTLAGTLSIAELSAGVETLAQAMTLLEANADTLRHDLGEGSPETEWDPAPAQTLDHLLDITLSGDRPESIGAGEATLVLIYGLSDHGYVLLGIGSGAESLQVRVPQTALPMVAVGWLESGGAGSGGGRSMAVAPVLDDAATLDAWVTPPTLGPLYAADGSFSLESDPAALLVRVHIASGNGGVRDIYLPVGAVEDTLAQDPGLALGRTEWDIQAIHTLRGSYQEALAQGWLDPAWIEAEGTALGGLDTQVTGQ